MQALLAALRQEGVRLWLDGDALRYQAPKGAMTPQRLSDLRTCKSKLIAFMQQAEQASAQAAPRIEVTPRSGRLPLSFTQERLWLLERIEDLGPAYHIASGIRLTGPFDPQVFAQVMVEIVQRHEILRTRFVADDNSIEQVIDTPGVFQVEYTDLSLVAPPGRQQAEQQHARATVLRRFDLAAGPLFRATLLRLGAEEHIVLVVMHHIVSDGWSLGVLIRELGALYTAFSQGRESPLAALPVQYADYALWQRGWLQGSALEQQMAYWTQRLSGANTALDLPLDRPRPKVQSFRGASLSFAIPKVLSEQLQMLARTEGATLFMVLLAGFQHLLSRWSGQDDIVVGTPVAGRTDQRTEGLIGFFVNTLVLRTDVSGDPSMRMLLARAKDTALQAYAQQDLPFEKLVEELNPVRDLSRSPIFQVLLALQNYPEEGLSLPGIQLSRLDSGHTASHAAKLDLSLFIIESADGLFCTVEYASDIFDVTTIDRFARHFQLLLANAVQQPDRSLSTFELLSEVERQCIVFDWNATTTDYPGPQPLAHLFEAQVDSNPQALALICGEQQLSYGALNARANQLAHYLRRKGVRCDMVVGVRMQRSVEMVVALLGILKAGAAYLPLEPSYPAARIDYMLDDAKPALVLSMDSPWPELRSLVSTNPQSQGTQHSLAYVIYTSGSTGKPKGVGISHEGIVNRLNWMQQAYGLKPDDRVLQKTPFSFDVSVWEFFWPLLQGARLVMARPDGHQDPTYLAEVIAQQQITTLHFVPPMLEAFLSQTTERNLPSLRRVICSGQALSKELQDRFLKRWPAVQLHNLYGPTEASVDVTAWTCTVDSALLASVPIGRPIANTQIYILDSQFNPVPVGVTGELYIAGVGLARGYLNQPALTAECFVPNPFGTPGARMYRSGDLARYSCDGRIDYLGRIDHQVKIRGFRIELEEIEAALLAQPGVGQALVLARQDQPGGSRLVAYVVAARGELEIGQLRSGLSLHLPEYMVPAYYVMLDAMPLTSNGKIDRKALPAPGDDAVLRRTFEAPRGLAEETIGAVWAKLLCVERISRQDNFFELGGHSLLAVRMIETLRKDGLSVDVRSIFSSATLAELAEQVRTHQAEDEVPANRILPGSARITPDMLPLVSLTQTEIETVVASVHGGVPNVQDIYPLAPLQEGFLFHHVMGQQGDAYLQQAMLAFSQRETLDRFLAALEEVIAREDILRTAIVWEGLREPVQVVWRQATLVVDALAPSSPADDAVAQLRAHRDPRHYRIKLYEAPLLRCTKVYDSARERWLLQILFHHLIDDATSLRLLVAQIQIILSDQRERLPATVPFRNYVARTRWAASQAMHDAFFKAMLAPVQAPTLPFGLVDTYGEGLGIAEVRRTLNLTLARGIRHQARVAGVSAASLVHLAWALVMARTSGRTADVVFGTVLFGRLQGGADIVNALGPFINTLPVRIMLGTDCVRDCLLRTHGSLTELLVHEHAPLALAQRCSSLPTHMPLFSALLNYRHHVIQEEKFLTPDESFASMQVLDTQERTNYPLTLMVEDLGEGFGLIALVDCRISAELICGYMETALASMVNLLACAPQTPITQVKVLPDDDALQISGAQIESSEAFALPMSTETSLGAERSLAPRTAVEAELADIWAEVLKLDRVGVHENFFELGGNSLLAIRVLSRIRARAAKHIPLAALFAFPSIASLAQEFERNSWSFSSK